MKNKVILVLIVLLAFFLRTYKVGINPPSVYGDEIAFAWNAYNILKTGQDEYGTLLPLQFKSFGDYKAPLSVYILVPVIKLFGMNAWSIRLVVSILSTLTVLMTYFLVKIVFKTVSKNDTTNAKVSDKIALLTAFFFSLSSWHIHLSRGYFEATIALFFLVIGLLYFFKGFKGTRFIYISAICLTLSLYSYFTPRIITPFWLIFLSVYAVKINPLVKKRILGFLIFIFLLSLPLLYLNFFSQGANRFSFLINQRYMRAANSAVLEQRGSGGPILMRKLLHNKILVLLREIKNEYLEHYSLNFWYLYGDDSLRYFLGNMGMFYLYEMPFLIGGILFCFKKYRNAGIFFLAWLLIGPIPSSIVGRSFAVRSLSMLPAPFVFVGLGFFFLNQKLAKVSNKTTYTIIAISLVTISLVNYLVRYYHDYPIYAATWWGWENKAAVDYALKREKDYDQIFISNFYTGAELAYAFYTQYDPLSYRVSKENPVVLADGRHFIKLGKFYFGSLDLNPERLKQGIIPKKSLYIGRPEEPDGEDVIQAPVDGRTLFKIHFTE